MPQDYAGPQAPTFDVNTIIKGIIEKIGQNKLQFYLVVIIAVLAAAYVLYMVWEEYKKNPVKLKPAKWGKMGKLSDLIKKKK